MCVGVTDEDSLLDVVFYFAKRMVVSDFCFFFVNSVARLSCAVCQISPRCLRWMAKTSFDKPGMQCMGRRRTVST